MKKQQELKWQRLKQNWLQGEEMPLVKKPVQKTLKNGKIPPQNGELANHCSVPVQITEIKEIKTSEDCKLQWLEDKSQAKNFWLT